MRDVEVSVSLAEANAVFVYPCDEVALTAMPVAQHITFGKILEATRESRSRLPLRSRSVCSLQRHQ